MAEWRCAAPSACSAANALTGGLSQGLLGISCFESASAAPWTDRGLWALGSGIVAGLVIDLIFVNLVSCLSCRLSAQSTANTNAPFTGELARIQPCK